LAAFAKKKLFLCTLHEDRDGGGSVAGQDEEGAWAAGEERKAEVKGR
jgi:hypothetical protein